MAFFRRIIGFLIVSVMLASPARGQIESLLLPGDEPVEFKADRLEYFRQEDQFIAEGSVEVKRGLFRLTADRAQLDNVSRKLTAEGSVRVEEGGSLLTADRVEYDLDTGEGTLYQSTLFLEEVNLFVRADRIEKQKEDRYRIHGATLTTCDLCEGMTPLWQFRVDDASLQIDGYLSAQNVKFDLKGLPVLYVPYLLMPVKATRQTGLLVPRIGINSDQGIKYNQDFFWAIASNQDATISVDYRSSRGVGGGLEYRYALDRQSRGESRFRYFDDRSEGEQRLGWEWKHQQVLFQNLHARVDLHLVNDTDQFRDLSEVTVDRVRETLESNFIVYHRTDNHYVYFSGRYTKDLIESEPASSERSAVQRLPEVGYQLHPFLLFGLPLYAGLEASGTNFSVKDEDKTLGVINAQRLDAFPNVSGRFNLFGVVLSPRAGWRGTWYSEGLSRDEPVQRSVGIYDLDGRMRLSKSWRDAPEGSVRRLLHHVEPAVIYEYVPEVDQDDLPKFDEIDQLPTKNLVTYSLTNSLVGFMAPQGDQPGGRREVLQVRVTQSYDVREKRRDESGRTVRPFSNIRGEATLRPFADTWIELDSFYDVYGERTVMVNTDFKTQVNRYLLVSVSQRMSREGTATPIGDAINPLSQTDETLWYTQSSPMIRFYSGYARLDFPFGLSLASRAYYDAELEEMAEIDYGLQYDGGCWALAASYIDLPDENQVSFLITLKTAGSTESNALIDLFKTQP